MRTERTFCVREEAFQGSSDKVRWAGDMIRRVPLDARRNLVYHSSLWR